MKIPSVCPLCGARLSVTFDFIDHHIYQRCLTCQALVEYHPKDRDVEGDPQ